MTQKEAIANLNKTVYGNGKLGLTTEVELLKKTQNEMLWWVRAIGMILIGWIASQLLGLIPTPVPTSSVEGERVHAVAALELPATENTELPSVLEPITDRALPVLKPVTDFLEGLAQ